VDRFNLAPVHLVLYYCPAMAPAMALIIRKESTTTLIFNKVFVDEFLIMYHQKYSQKFRYKIFGSWHEKVWNHCCRGGLVATSKLSTVQILTLKEITWLRVSEKF